MVARKLTLVHASEVTTTTQCLSVDWELALNGWLTWLKIGGLSVNTLRLRRDHVLSIARRSNTQHPRELVLSLLIELCSERTWSNEYRKSMRTSLVSFSDWCVRNGQMAGNAAAELPRVAGDKPAPRPAPDDVWERLLEQASPREQLMARLAGEAGLRRAEVAGCKLDDLTRDHAGWVLIVRGKGNKQRVVPITVSLATAIRAHTDHGYLFPGPTGGHISPGWVGTIISRLMPEQYSMHKLRHRYATRGYAGTRNLRAVQEALGHASVATTERYTAVSRDEIRAVSESAWYHDDGPGAA